MQNLGQAAGSAVGAPPGGLQEKILRILQRSPHTLTPHDLEKMTVRRWAVDRRQVSAALRSLMAEGILAYRYDGTAARSRIDPWTASGTRIRW